MICGSRIIRESLKISLLLVSSKDVVVEAKFAPLCLEIKLYIWSGDKN